MRVVDLGCGMGDLTEELHRCLGARETLGIDSSQAMLQKAGTCEGLTFSRQDIRAFEGKGEYDLVFSNAAVHWVPEHRQLFARLTAALTDHGQLAIQVPANFDHVSHTTARDVAEESPFEEALGGFTHSSFVLTPEGYASLLEELGYREQEVRLRVYAHHLESREEVVEWMKGSLLTVYQRRMPGEIFSQFLERYRERLLARLEDTRPYLFLFKRILLWAAR
jgi:trans-aconitate 2-methyltransferase